MNLPELKIVKPSVTRWLAHERCVKAEANYAVIVITLENIYEQSHEPEALGISKALSKEFTLSAILLLDFVLPLVIKLSKCLPTEKLDLSIISSLVHATLHTIDEALLPAANWVLKLMAAREEIDLSCYGEDCIDTILKHYGKDLTAESVLAEENVKPALVSSDITLEWKMYKRYIAQHPKEDMKAQLKELATNSMLIAMFPNLSFIANICLSIPVGTASVERSFSQIKMIKTRLRNHLGEMSLSLMKMAIESPQKICDRDLEEVIDVWNRKPRRIVV